jgi:hypothetical protein
MTPFELLAALYFAGLGIAAAAADVPWRRRTVVMAASLFAAGGVAAMPAVASEIVRGWAPHLYLVAGYWLPGLLTRPFGMATPFERWLAASDRWFRPRLPGVPGAFAHVTELAYLLCYPLVPGSFAVVWALGTAADVSRFWVAVLAAGYACYATLPWLPSRPPRLVETPRPARHVGALNAIVLGRVSHQLNTFPSGHVAVSFAAAGALWAVSPPAALVMAAMAAGVGVGAAAGRYHYVVDVWLGMVVALIALGVSQAVV